jgi:hypothetical protein
MGAYIPTCGLLEFLVFFVELVVLVKFFFNQLLDFVYQSIVHFCIAV